MIQTLKFLFPLTFGYDRMSKFATPSLMMYLRTQKQNEREPNQIFDIHKAEVLHVLTKMRLGLNH